MNDTPQTPAVTPEEIRAHLANREFASIKRWIRSIPDADLAEFFTHLSLEECVPLLRLVPKSRRAIMFSYLPFDLQEQMITELPEVVVTGILNNMEAVDRTKLLEDLDPGISSRIILRLAPDERQIVWQLLSYPENSVGRMMTPEFISVKQSLRVSDALEYVRWHAAQYAEEMILHIFVTDDAGCYVGDASLARLFTSEPLSQTVGECMQAQTVLLNAYDDQEKAVDAFRKYDRPYLPVVNEKDILVGVVMAEDVFDVAEEEASEDLQQFGGIEALEDSYFQTASITLLRKRAIWLAVLFLGGILTGNALKIYNNTFNDMRYLLFFLPLIISSGGNSGSQAASLIIRGIAVKDMDIKDWYQVLWREISSGISLGLFLAILGYFLAQAWGLPVPARLIIAFSLVGVVTFGTIVGSMLPFILKRSGLDPAVCSSPLIASLVDVIGVVIFANVALFASHFFAP